ncbi:hypothetical protein ACN38_g1585 [Penicillium nordicum]|uniref:Uncharacterized protein n=1 Tax=Penicillium nordicum TaxID=229535 RepID=A0A0M9WJN1_9EURO|nr:hypothetical protein ACN38_g1585 [Penicillium nordicum]
MVMAIKIGRGAELGLKNQNSIYLIGVQIIQVRYWGRCDDIIFLPDSPAPLRPLYPPPPIAFVPPFPRSKHRETQYSVLLGLV